MSVQQFTHTPVIMAGLQASPEIANTHADTGTCASRAGIKGSKKRRRRSVEGYVVQSEHPTMGRNSDGRTTEQR